MLLPMLIIAFKYAAPSGYITRRHRSEKLMQFSVDPVIQGLLSVISGRKEEKNMGEMLSWRSLCLEYSSPPPP